MKVCLVIGLPVSTFANRFSSATVKNSRSLGVLPNLSHVSKASIGFLANAPVLTAHPNIVLSIAKYPLLHFGNEETVILSHFSPCCQPHHQLILPAFSNQRKPLQGGVGEGFHSSPFTIHFVHLINFSHSSRNPLKTLISTSVRIPLTLPSGESCQKTRLSSGLYSP